MVYYTFLIFLKKYFFEFSIRIQKLHFIRILASKTYFNFDMKCTNMESQEDLLLNDNDIIIMIKKEFTDES